MIYRKEKLTSIPEELRKEDVVFAVLIRILLDFETELTITDHKNYVISYSEKPYPVLVWTKDNLSKEEYLKIWNEAKEHFPLEAQRFFCVKKEFAEYIREQDGLEVDFEFLSYECTEVTQPTRELDGVVELATASDIDTLTQFTYDFQREAGIDMESSYDESRVRVEKKVANGEFYLYKIDNMSVAMTSISEFNGMSKISHVYTLNDYRRKGYAESLVYSVTKQFLDQGNRVVLYTDASYKASNSCYIGIGFKYVGSFVRIATK